MNFEEFRQRIGEILHGASVDRYERHMRQQTAELNDLFLLLCFMEATALPNPATRDPANPSANLVSVANTIAARVEMGPDVSCLGL